MLGIRYLWIDSLCIIQDSKEDWSYEASLMGQYYQNSAVTIAAVGAEDGNDGLFVGSTFSITPCPVAIKFPQFLTPVEGFLRPSMEWDAARETTGFHRPPLWRRAWVSILADNSPS
jgi:Heterokaryon incompatibility protein (HET)